MNKNSQVYHFEHFGHNPLATLLAYCEHQGLDKIDFEYCAHVGSSNILDHFSMDNILRKSSWAKQYRLLKNNLDNIDSHDLSRLLKPIKNFDCEIKTLSQSQRYLCYFIKSLVQEKPYLFIDCEIFKNFEFEDRNFFQTLLTSSEFSRNKVIYLSNGHLIKWEQDFPKIVFPIKSQKLAIAA